MKGQEMSHAILEKESAGKAILLEICPLREQCPLRSVHGFFMSNNIGVPLTWQQLLAKHGPWALGCAVMGYVIFTFILTPSQKEREAFIETSVQNAESMDTVADSTTVIKGSVERQEHTMDKMSQELEKQSDLRETAMDTMNAFATEMREVNPANAIKLDILLKKAAEDKDGVKLDIIIEKIEQLKTDNLEEQ